MHVILLKQHGMHAILFDIMGCYARYSCNVHVMLVMHAILFDIMGCYADMLCTLYLHVRTLQASTNIQKP